MLVRFYLVLVTLLAWLSSIEVVAQTNYFLHFSVPEGLPSSEVYDIYQDRKGFVWFATDNGVVRFDGKNMELFQTNEGLTDPVVFEFIEDGKQRIWFRTFSGKLSYFENEKIHPYEFNDQLAKICQSFYPGTIEIDADDRVWFGAGYVYGSIDARGKLKMDTAGIFEMVLHQTQRDIVIANWGPINRLNKVTLGSRSYPVDVNDFNPIHQKISKIQWRGKQYFAIGSCIYKIDQQSLEIALRAPDQIISLSVDNQDNLWVGYLRSGTSCFIDFNSEKLIHFDFLKSMAVTKVIQDQEGGYWISTTQNGVYYVPDIELHNYQLPVHSRVNNTVALGNITAVADDKGLVLTLDDQGKILNQKKLSFASISMLNESDKRLWVSTSGSTYLFSNTLKEEKEIPISMSSLSQDPEGNIRGISGLRYVRLDRNGNVLALTSNIKRTVSCTERYIFYSERIGVEAFTYDGKKMPLPSSLNSVKMTKLSVLNDSLILIGTLGTGFFIINEKRWTARQYSSNDNFTANNIYSALVIGENLWLGTEKGLAIVPIKSLIAGNADFAFLFQEKYREKINHLTYNGSHVWAFTESSFYSVPPTFRKRNLPLFYMQNLLVNNGITRLDKNAKFDNDQNNIQINFRFVDFGNQDIMIRSRLSPQDNWSYSTEHNIKFYSLRANTYHLEIDYSVDNIHWHRATTWDFTILPPFWRSWYFETSVVLIAVLFATFYIRRRVARVNERNNYLNLINAQQQQLIRAELDTLEAERNRIAKDLHDSVGTNLSAIKMGVWSSLKKYNDPKAEVFETEFQNAIHDIKGIIHDLVPAGLDKYGLTEIVRDHVSRIEQNIDIKIEVNSFGPDINDPKLNLLSFRILQELLANTLKHAGASKIVIHINSFEDLLSILYQDNGKGFDPETVARGSGLYNIQSRVQTANGTVKFETGNYGVTYFIDIPLKLNGHDPHDSSR